MKKTDLSRSLEQLTGSNVGDPEDPENAPTEMVQHILRSWKKPLYELTDYEIGDLVIQHYGYPYVLDLVWPRLEADPLYQGCNYPGDILSLLIRASAEIWTDRPEYRARLDALCQRALKRPLDENDMFRKTLGLSKLDAPINR
jgi:hypothetical protein